MSQMDVVTLGGGWFPETPGGLERMYYALDRHLPSLGVSVKGLVVGSPEVSAATNGRVKSAAEPTASLFKRWWHFRRSGMDLLASLPPNCLVASHFALYALPLLDQLQSSPFVVHFHGPWAYESLEEAKPSPLTQTKALLETAVYRRADRLIVLSRAFRDVLCERYDVPTDRVRVVPGGVNVSTFETGLSREKARSKLGWAPRDPIVLSVRRLARRMGLKNLIDAFNRVHFHLPNAKLYIAGKGPLAETLQRRINELELSDTVSLLGFVPDADLPLIYRAADVSIVPTTALEGFGLITLESLAAGTPVLVTPVGGLPETVSALDPSLVLPDSTPRALSEGLLRILTNPETLPTAARCQQYVRSRFDWSVIASRVYDVYSEVL